MALKPSDVYVMCDGDTTPFNSVETWRHFRVSHPEVTFHFIALDKDSQHAMMSQMAAIGNGSFQDLSN